MLGVGGSVPELEETVPGAGAHAHPVLGHPSAAHPVVMTRQNSCRSRQEEERGEEWMRREERSG